MISRRRERPLAHPRRSSEPLLAAGRALHRREADPGGEVPARAERLGWRRQRLDGGGDQGADAGHGHEPTGDVVGFGPGGDLSASSAASLLLQMPQASRRARARQVRAACGRSGAGILDLSDQPLDVRRALRRDQPVLGQDGHGSR